MDLEIREFSNIIISYINEARLPMEVKRLVLRDISAKLEIATNEVIQVQIQARNKETEENEQKVENEGNTQLKNND